MVTTIPGSYINVYFGLSTDTKPTDDVPNASMFYEMDTVDVYSFDRDNAEWQFQFKLAAE